MALNLSRQLKRSDLKASHKPEKRPCNCHAINKNFSVLEQGDRIQPTDGYQSLYSQDTFIDRSTIFQPRCTTDDDMLDSLSSGISDQSMLAHIEQYATSTAQDQDYGMDSGIGSHADVGSRHMHAAIELPHLLELTDAALRTWICDNPIRPSAGIRLLTASHGPKLSQISPTLFSPGYLSVCYRSTLKRTLSSWSLAEFLGAGDLPTDALRFDHCVHHECPVKSSVILQSAKKAFKIGITSTVAPGC